MTKKTSPAYRASKEETIPINKLHPFSNHPFHIRHDLEFSELVDSISESGIITPIIVRPKVGVGYEVISGHRRWEACKELGIESIPARVEYIDDDEATILMVNSNIQREHVLPSEKAFAYKMRIFLQRNTVPGEAGVYHEIAAAEAVRIFDLANKGGNAFFLGKIFVYGYFPDVHQFIRVDLGFIWCRLHHGDLLSRFGGFPQGHMNALTGKAISAWYLTLRGGCAGRIGAT